MCLRGHPSRSLFRRGLPTGVSLPLFLFSCKPRNSIMRWMRKGWLISKLFSSMSSIFTPKYLSILPSSVSSKSSFPIRRELMTESTMCMCLPRMMQSSTYVNTMHSSLKNTHGSTWLWMNPLSVNPFLSFSNQLWPACLSPYRLLFSRSTYCFRLVSSTSSGVTPAGSSMYTGTSRSA